MHHSFVYNNVWLWTAFFAWVLAQLTKMLCGYTRTRKLDFRYLVSTGGMPSAHSALVSSVATAVGMTEGFQTPLATLAIVVAGVTMFDASTVRHAAGQQARLLNEIVEELFHAHHFSERKLKELLGHTRLEVFMGMVMGILTAMLVVSRCYLPVQG